MTRVPGRTLAVAWPTLDDAWKHHYVEEVVNICETLVGWESPMFGGVDGKNLTDHHLIDRDMCCNILCRCDLYISGVESL